MTTSPAQKAPSQLATTTDLAPDQVVEITRAINPIIADAFALYVKTKNYHWHVAGSHFHEYHELFDDQSKSIRKSIDPMAERVRRIGGVTIRGVGQISQMQTIKDDNEEYVPPGEMMRRLMEDNLQMARSLRAAIEVCERNHDMATTHVLQDLLDETERRKWFLFETLQGGDKTN
jgi:starvation-inducible DNA-binding protein